MRDWELVLVACACPHSQKCQCPLLIRGRHASASATSGGLRRSAIRCDGPATRRQDFFSADPPFSPPRTSLQACQSEPIRSGGPLPAVPGAGSRSRRAVAGALMGEWSQASGSEGCKAFLAIVQRHPVSARHQFLHREPSRLDSMLYLQICCIKLAEQDSVCPPGAHPHACELAPRVDSPGPASGP